MYKPNLENFILADREEKVFFSVLIYPHLHLGKVRHHGRIAVGFVHVGKAGLFDYADWFFGYPQCLGKVGKMVSSEINREPKLPVKYKRYGRQVYRIKHRLILAETIAALVCVFREAIDFRSVFGSNQCDVKG